MDKHHRKLVYCTPSLYIAGGIERVLTTKANYFADVLGYDVYIILTDGQDKKNYFPLSSKIKVINLNLGFEELWNLSFIKKVWVYLRKQYIYKIALRKTLLSIRPDITISTGRRELNFLCDIPDGSKKICEIHVNRNHYRNFEGENANWFKNLFSKLWMRNLISQLKRFDQVVCLTSTDAAAWKELDNVAVIPNPLSEQSTTLSDCQKKNVIAVGRYTYQKGFDMLLKIWSIVNKKHPDWHLNIYGAGDRTPYQQQCEDLGLSHCCHLYGEVPNINKKYAESSILAVSSRFEGFGMIIIEAMQCGIPVVSFDCPYGPRDIITDGTDGLLAKNGDTNDFATKLCDLIENNESREHMGKNATKAAKRYSTDHVMNFWIDLFNAI